MFLVASLGQKTINNTNILGQDHPLESSKTHVLVSKLLWDNEKSAALKLVMLKLSCPIT